MNLLRKVQLEGGRVTVERERSDCARLLRLCRLLCGKSRTYRAVRTPQPSPAALPLALGGKSTEGPLLITPAEKGATHGSDCPGDWRNWIYRGLVHRRASEARLCGADHGAQSIEGTGGAGGGRIRPIPRSAPTGYPRYCGVHGRGFQESCHGIVRVYPHPSWGGIRADPGGG